MKILDYSFWDVPMTTDFIVIMWTWKSLIDAGWQIAWEKIKAGQFDKIFYKINWQKKT